MAQHSSDKAPCKVRHGCDPVVAIACAVVLSLFPPGVAFAQYAQPAPTTVGEDQRMVRPTLEGCWLPLPGGLDRDSGLSQLHVARMEGRPYLLTPSITLRQTYSDNITLAKENTQSDFVTQFIPALTFCRVGPRLRAQVDYEGQILRYWDESQHDDVFHRLNADTTTTLVRDRLFLEAGASHVQQPLSSRARRGAFGDDNVLVTGNRVDAVNLRVSPYLIQDLGPAGTSVTRYTFDRTTYEEVRPDQTVHSGSFLVTSPAAAEPLSWQASIRSDRVERERRGFDDVRYFDDAFLDLGYLLTGRLTVLGRAGVETETLRDGSQDRFGSSYWYAGFRWEDDRTSIEARYGRRFFGDTYFAAVTRRAANLTLRLNYNETHELSDQFARREELFLFIDPETGDVELIPFVDVLNEVVIHKRATASATYVTGRSTLRAAAFSLRREFLVAENNEDRYGANAFWRWQWRPRTALIPRLTWERTDFRDDRTDKLYGGIISVAHLLSPTMQAGASVRRQKRTSTEAGAGHTENAVILEITRAF